MIKTGAYYSNPQGPTDTVLLDEPNHGLKLALWKWGYANCDDVNGDGTGGQRRLGPTDFDPAAAPPLG
jgi:hypothetical protein